MNSTELKRPPSPPSINHFMHSISPMDGGVAGCRKKGWSSTRRLQQEKRRLCSHLRFALAPPSIPTALPDPSGF
ncbi:unnamed protein product [Linum trigynum]|uniref:Uncharacterized protein n=1 Tax=Linum trigynum TaxID=586398 RepID=A0AAV2CUK0_9ROSI